MRGANKARSLADIATILSAEFANQFGVQVEKDSPIWKLLYSAAMRGWNAAILPPVELNKKSEQIPAVHRSR